ncbi:hypothetical protein [Roseomonas genomospecies 6]|uniref:hypothetical protein n=1 Tax=Roseomonas genomospecies 6 TaxID=214106 RepID=UPI0011F180A7|nr:hypothetical protein [Roseomonas genomospecies 6]
MAVTLCIGFDPLDCGVLLGVSGGLGDGGAAPLSGVSDSPSSTNSPPTHGVAGRPSALSTTRPPCCRLGDGPVDREESQACAHACNDRAAK